MEWANWLQTNWARLTVARTKVRRYLISTVFLGINYSFSKGRPVVWETAVLTGKGTKRKMVLQRRCAGSREQALAQHDAMVERARSKNLL